MGEWYYVTKRIKGRAYLYHQRTWREGRHVRTQSYSLGPVDPVGEVRRSSDRAFAPISQTEAVERWSRSELCMLRPVHLIDVERNAIERYTSARPEDRYYERINANLRDNIELASGDREIMEGVFSALHHPMARMSSDVYLYRKALVPFDVSIGGIIDYFSFMSLSVSLDVARDFPVTLTSGKKPVILVLAAKAFTRGYISAKGMTDIPAELEIIRFGGSFLVTDVISDGEAQLYFIEEEGGYEIK